MAYASGDTILDDHYNTFVRGGASAVDHNTANVNTVWGTAATGDKGYGQSGDLSAVSAGTTITATQWVNLLNRVSTIANHQGTSITAISNPTTGDTISAYTALSGNISSIFTNRLNCAASGSDITAGGAISGTNTWRDLQTTTITVDFDTNAKARYFFNAGGRIALSFSRTGGTASSKNTGWSNLCTACGTIYFSGGSGSATIAGGTYTGTNKSGGSGSTTTLSTTSGWYDLTTSFVEVFKQYDSTYLYTANYIKVEVKADAATPTQYQFKVSFVDAADTTGWADGTINDGGAELDETVDGTLAATCVVKPPATTYLSASWGTPTISGTAMGGDTYS